MFSSQRKNDDDDDDDDGEDGDGDEKMKSKEYRGKSPVRNSLSPWGFSPTPSVSRALSRESSPNGSEDKKSQGEKPTTKKKTIANRSRLHYFRVRCRDNGIGMVHKDIPQMMGIVLSSTKYGVRQTRGKFGIGAKAVRIRREG